MWNGLQDISQRGDYHRRFAYAIARNVGKLRPVIETLVEATKQVEEFEKVFAALSREMAKKDSKGEPIRVPGNQGFLLDDPTSFHERVKVLKVETGQDKRDKEIEELMVETEEIDIYMVSFDLIPEKINPTILDAIMAMITEPTEEEFSSKPLPDDASKGSLDKN